MKDILLVNYTARRGGGPIDACEMAKALIDLGVPVAALISAQVENLEEWKKLKLEKLVMIDTYESVGQFVIRSAMFPFRQRRQIIEELKGYRVRDVYCPMISVWNPLINPIFKNTRKSLVIHDPTLHPGERLKYAAVKRKYGQYDVFFVHSRKYVEPVRSMYKKPTYYILLARHNYYKGCENKKEIVTYDPTKINFLFFGRITKYKRLDLLARAYKVLREKTDIDATLTIVGDGDFSPYKAMYDELPDVTIVNRWIDDREVESVFTGENIICICPYQEATQSGVILVAMDYGATLIVSNSGGMDEQIDDGRTGLLFKEGDARDLARKMYKVAKDEMLRKRLSQNAIEEIEKCTWDNSARGLVEALEIDYYKNAI